MCLHIYIHIIYIYIYIIIYIFTYIYIYMSPYIYMCLHIYIIIILIVIIIIIYIYIYQHKTVGLNQQELRFYEQILDVLPATHSQNFLHDQTVRFSPAQIGIRILPIGIENCFDRCMIHFCCMSQVVGDDLLLVHQQL